MVSYDQYLSDQIRGLRQALDRIEEGTPGYWIRFPEHSSDLTGWHHTI